jgi:hypothetical protein
MEFFLYLTPVGREIITNIMIRNYNVKENAPICKQKNLLGLLSSPDFVICTNNIKNRKSPVSYYVNETVTHEAVHVIQACKKGQIGIRGIQLNQEKLNNVAGSLASYKSSPVYEVESYYLEDKPEEVLKLMKKFCF